MTKRTKKIDDDPVLYAAFEQGQRAYASAIDKRDAPHGDGPELDAWNAGYDFAKAANG